jgi:hypothetical protein
MKDLHFQETVCFTSDRNCKIYRFHTNYTLLPATYAFKKNYMLKNPFRGGKHEVAVSVQLFKIHNRGHITA